ncbi:MAG: hypothetical protein QXY45_04560, partial [Candidatus Aenigmatarchaeota archaeon]
KVSGEKIKTIFINTWDNNTAPALLTKIVLELGYPIPRRGLSKDEILEKLIELLKKRSKPIVIGLDEVDQLIKKDDSALYDLLRINQYVDTPVGLVMISNYENIFSEVEPRIKSSLSIEDLKFKGYNLEEMKDILNERCREAFRPGVVQEGVVLVCANHAINRGGDVRIGLECLRKAAKLCEEEGKDKILVDHVRRVIKEVKAVKIKIMRENLEGVDKNIVELLEEMGEVVFTDFENEYNKRFQPITHMGLKKHIDHLESIGIVKIRTTRKESRGLKTFLRLTKRKKFN